MKILIFGSGSAREHATFRRLSIELPQGNALFALLGENAILEAEVGVFKVNDVEDAAIKSKQHNVDLVLLLGYAELLYNFSEIFKKHGCAVLEMPQSIVRLESSKQHSKSKMLTWGVPTAAQWEFKDLVLAREFLIKEWDKFSTHFVIKTDSMVDNPSHRAILPDSLTSALEALELLGKYDNEIILIEQRLEGAELSVHVLYDSNSYIILPVVQDYKRLFKDDLGPNTAGMGAIASTFTFDNLILKKIEETIIIPTIKGIREIDNSAQMILYIGVILTKDGPQVLEYNIRSGNPEWLALLALIDSSISELFKNLKNRTLDRYNLKLKKDKCSIVTVIVGDGYPEESKAGLVPISGSLECSSNFEIVGEKVISRDQQLHADSGRVLMIMGSAPSWEEARRKTNQITANISFPGMYFREDIGSSGIKL